MFLSADLNWREQALARFTVDHLSNGPPATNPSLNPRILDLRGAYTYLQAFGSSRYPM